MPLLLRSLMNMASLEIMKKKFQVMRLRPYILQEMGYSLTCLKVAVALQFRSTIHFIQQFGDSIIFNGTISDDMKIGNGINDYIESASGVYHFGVMYQGEFLTKIQVVPCACS